MVGNRQRRQRGESVAQGTRPQHPGRPAELEDADPDRGGADTGDGPDTGQDRIDHDEP